jgi:hypothetical protein
MPSGSERQAPGPLPYYLGYLAAWTEGGWREASPFDEGPSLNAFREGFAHGAQDKLARIMKHRWTPRPEPEAR